MGIVQRDEADYVLTLALLNTLDFDAFADTFASSGGESSMNFRVVVNRLSESMRNFFAVMVDQESMSSSLVIRTPIRVLWTSFNYFVLIAIFGYLLNFISIDTITFKSPKSIDSLEEMISDEFDNVRAIILKQMYFYEVIVESVNQPVSPHDQNLIRLFEKIYKFNYSIVELDVQNSADPAIKLNFIQNLVLDNEGALIKFEMVLGNILRMVFETLPDDAYRQYISSNPISTGTLAPFYSKKINNAVKKYINFRNTNFVEFGLAGEANQEFIKANLDTMTGSTAKGDMCKYRYEMSYDDWKDHSPFTDFSIESLRKSLIACLSLIVISLIAMMVEQVVNSIDKRIKLRKAQIASKKARRKRIRKLRRRVTKSIRTVTKSQLTN